MIHFFFTASFMYLIVEGALQRNCKIFRPLKKDEEGFNKMKIQVGTTQPFVCKNALDTIKPHNTEKNK